jgi:hypothetical protein
MKGRNYKPSLNKEIKRGLSIIDYNNLPAVNYFSKNEIGRIKKYIPAKYGIHIKM